jgi:hypothetical protein
MKAKPKEESEAILKEETKLDAEVGLSTFSAFSLNVP